MRKLEHGNTGTRILCVSGDVRRPGSEVEVGKMTMENFSMMSVGPLDGREFRAVIMEDLGKGAQVLGHLQRLLPTGTDKRDITFDEILDFDTMAACGSMAGSGGVIVMDDSPGCLGS